MSISTAAGCVAPYTPAETAEAAAWLPYVESAVSAARGDQQAAVCEAIDKDQCRAGLSVGAAALLAEVYNVSPEANQQAA